MHMLFSLGRLFAFQSLPQDSSSDLDEDRAQAESKAEIDDWSIAHGFPGYMAFYQFWHWTP